MAVDTGGGGGEGGIGPFRAGGSGGGLLYWIQAPSFKYPSGFSGGGLGFSLT